VTLARDVSPDDAVLFWPAFAPVEGLAWRVNEVVLFRSHLGPGGSRYDALAHLPLLGGTES
jgi:2'-5' RNA ligase